ncbi:MAG TPA: carboxypeptidase-like regulatory domain-containing protein [Bryobacteraceae bacterium]
MAPKYYILSVIYAPPGTQSGNSSSSVTYGSGSTAGTTVGSSNSFKQSYKLTATASFGDPKVESLDLGLSFAYGRNSTDTSAMDIKKTKAAEINVKGPGVDGIDHDRDQIWLWLNPRVRMQMRPQDATWTFEDGQTADIQFVFVGHLKHPDQIPPGVLQRLQKYGITPADYTDILKADPFANGAAAIDPSRYKSLHTTFPYEPPFAPGDPATTFQTTMSTSTIDTTTSTTQNDYSVGLTVQADSATFISLFKSEIKSENSWTWTDTCSTGTSTNIQESAAVTVGGPAFGYTGPTDMGVYYDTRYKTFLFAPVTGTIQLRGLVKSSSGKKASGQEVLVTANGKRYRTFTNANGEYRIPEKIAGPVQVRVGRVTKQVAQPGASLDIAIP